MAKKKHTHQHQQQTHHKPRDHEMDPNQPTPIDDPAEKLSSLKSLNAVLLKETVEKRQEVSALLESKKSLESELTRSVSEVEGLRAELGRMEVGGLVAEVRKGVVSAFVESQMANEVELLRREKEKFEMENEGLRREKEGLERSLEDLERDMGEVVKERDEMEKKKIEGDLEIGSMKKFENELRNEIKRERESFNQAIRDNESLKRDFEFQVEEGHKMREKLVEIEGKEKRVAEELGELKSKYLVAVEALDVSKNVVEATRVELGSLKRNCDELKSEIEGLKGENELILRDKAELQKEKSERIGEIGELEMEVDRLNDVVLNLKKDEQKWRVKVFELEKANDETRENLEELSRDLNAILEEKKQKEKEIKSLMGEKSSAMGRLDEMEKELETVKQVTADILKEKGQLEQAKSREDNVILELQNKVNELLGNMSSLQQSNSVQLDMNKRLLSEIDGHKGALDRVTLERDDLRKTLEEEKMNGMKLQSRVSEISKKMEETGKVIEELRAASDTFVGEKKKLESKHSKLVEEKGLVGKQLVDAQKKITDLEVSMRSKSGVFESALAMLKKTTLQLSMTDEKKGEDEAIASNDRGINGEIEPYLAELEAIREIFRSREEKVREMQRQMESLQCCVMDERKKKSFWALVSSATTVLAAVGSFAYAARVR